MSREECAALLESLAVHSLPTRAYLRRSISYPTSALTAPAAGSHLTTQLLDTGACIYTRTPSVRTLLCPHLTGRQSLLVLAELLMT